MNASASSPRRSQVGGAPANGRMALEGVPAVVAQETSACLVLEVEHGTYLLDVGSSSVFLACSSLAEVLPALLAGGTAVATSRAQSRGLDGGEVKGILRDLAALQREGFLDGGAPPPRQESRTGYELIISAFHGCNLRCRYCFSHSGKDYRGDTRAVGLPTAIRALEFFVADFARPATEVTVNFTADGEAMLNYPFIRELTDHCRRLEDHLGKAINVGFVTNGTLLSDDQLQFLHSRNVSLTFSLDGPPAVHDKMRPFPQGRPSHATVVENLTRYTRNTGRPLKGAAVLTEESIPFEGVVSHFMELGFTRISTKPPRPDGRTSWSVNADNLAAFERGYSGLVLFLLHQVVTEGDFRQLDLIVNRNDYFGRFLGRLVTGARSPYRCKAALNRLALAADGSLYPCQDFIGFGAMRLGDAERGIDQVIRDEFLDSHVDRRAPCRECFARYLCGGGCYAAAYRVNGDIAKPDENKCFLTRHLVRLAVYFMGELQRCRPEAIERIHRLFSGLAVR